MPEKKQWRFLDYKANNSPMTARGSFGCFVKLLLPAFLFSQLALAGDVKLA
jgi:hypothetical protein